MPINLASPGIVVKEVDLTVGRVDPTSGTVGGLVGPFTKGPVELPPVIANENDLLNTLEQEGMGCIIFSPLSKGMLSTK